MRIRVLVLLALARTALADPIVDWQAPAGCPTAADVDARVALRVGDARPHTPVAVVVAAGAGGFIATIGDGDADTRTLTSASCDELADAVALVVERMVLDAPAAALSLAPVLAPPDAAISVAPQPHDAEPHDAEVHDAGPSEPSLRRTAPPGTFGMGVRLSVIGDIGAQPDIGVGGELAVPFHWHDLLVEPAASLSAQSTEMGTAGAVAVSLREVAARVGWHPAHLPLRAWVAGQLGSLTGTGEGMVGARRGSAAWASAGAGAAGIWRFWGPMAAVFAVEVAVPLMRPQFMSDSTILFRPGPLVSQLAIGVEVAWR